MTDETSAPERKPVDLLKFAGGLVFFSITTALAISAIFRTEGVVTISGGWEVLVNLYRSVLHVIFGGLARLVPIRDFVIDADESELIGVVGLTLLPTAFAIPNRALAALMAFPFVMLVLAEGLAGNSHSLPPVMGVPGLVFHGLVFVVFGCVVSVIAGAFFAFARNLLGAVIIILALMTTGFFQING